MRFTKAQAIYLLSILATAVASAGLYLIGAGLEESLNISICTTCSIYGLVWIFKMLGED